MDDDAQLLGKATESDMLPGGWRTSAADTVLTKAHDQSSPVSRLLAQITKRGAIAVDGGTTPKQSSAVKPKRIRMTAAAPAAPVAVVASRRTHKPKKILLSPAEPLPAKTIRAAPTKRIPFTSPASRRDDPRRLLGNYGDVFAVDADSSRDDEDEVATQAEAVASSVSEAPYNPSGGVGSALTAMPTSAAEARPLTSRVDIMKVAKRAFSGDSAAGRSMMDLQRPFSVEMMPSGLQGQQSIESMPSSLAAVSVGRGLLDELGIPASAPSLVVRGHSSSSVGSGDVADMQGQTTTVAAADALAAAAAIPSPPYQPPPAPANMIVSTGYPMSATVSSDAKLLLGGTSATTSAFSAADDALAASLGGSSRSSGYTTADVSLDSFSSFSWPSLPLQSPSTAAADTTGSKGRARGQDLMLSPGKNLDDHHQVMQVVPPSIWTITSSKSSLSFPNPFTPLVKNHGICFFTKAL